ncbi:triacylglycerol lipase, partial [Vibrio parahaemolyticus]
MKIIILHGLYMHGLVMQPLSQKLRKLGYETQVLSYNTVAIDESSLFDSIDHSLNPLTANVLVGHSLGGLMIKRYLANRKPTTSLISHVVAIGSPL